MLRLLTIVGLLNCFSLHASDVDWPEWNVNAFEKAQEEDKLVFLHLGANWCHWCHVMEQETYMDSSVLDYLDIHFLTYTADQDKNAALGQKYRAYGWPALIIFNSNGEELRKIAGYRSPTEFLKILQEVIENPNPVLQVKRSFEPDVSSISQWRDRYYATLDTNIGGYRGPQKFVDEPTFLYSFLDRQSPTSLAWTNASMRSAFKLLDPVWGGVYQYSTHYSWNYPHYEKLLNKQARYVRMFALWGQKQEDNRQKQEVASAIRGILSYVDNFLTSPDGRFYTAQDADIVQGEKAHDYFASSDEMRRSIGIPVIDKNIYPDENGQMIRAYIYAWAYLGESKYLTKAIQVYDNVIDSSYSSGLYKHDNHSEVYLLNDQLSMLQASQELYLATGNNRYLSHLELGLKSSLSAFYQNGKLLSFIGDVGVNQEADFETKCATLTLLGTWRNYVNSEVLNDCVSELYNEVENSEYLAAHYSVPELLLAHHSVKGEIGQAVLTGTPEERIQLRRATLLIPDMHKIAIEVEESTLSPQLWEGEATLYFCHGGRCDFPLSLTEIKLLEE